MTWFQTIQETRTFWVSPTRVPILLVEYPTSALRLSTAWAMFCIDYDSVSIDLRKSSCTALPWFHAICIALDRCNQCSKAHGQSVHPQLAHHLLVKMTSRGSFNTFKCMLQRNNELMNCMHKAQPVRGHKSELVMDLYIVHSSHYPKCKSKNRNKTQTTTKQTRKTGPNQQENQKDKTKMGSDYTVQKCKRLRDGSNVSSLV